MQTLIATLRQIMLAGLDDAVQFGKELDRYESRADGVATYFTDGSQARGDVLVGAEGIRSAVRRQRAPHAKTVDAGITAIYGRLPLESALAIAPEEVINDIFSIGTDERKVFLGSGAVRFPTPPQSAVAQFAPRTPMRSQQDYVVCIVGGRHEYFPTGLRSASGEALQQIAVSAIDAWPDRAKSLVLAGGPSSFFLVEMYTSVPCKLGAPANVTLLGDAIHAMTPTLGRGANLAMRDGALLGRELRNVEQGETTLRDGLANYERSMLAYGFDVVREAALVRQQRMDQNPLPTADILDEE